VRGVSKRPTHYHKYRNANKLIITVIILVIVLSSMYYHYHNYHSTTIFYKKIKKVKNEKDMSECRCKWYKM